MYFCFINISQTNSNTYETILNHVEQYTPSNRCIQNCVRVCRVDWLKQ